PLGCAGQHRESRVMHGNDVLNAKKTDGEGGFTRTHGKHVADRQHGDVRFVNFADEFHVPEDGGVSRVVNRRAAGKLDDVAASLAAVQALAVVFDGVGVKRVGHGDLEIPNLLR